MAKEYYKKSTGLAPTNTPKIRIYESVDDAVNDLDNLNVGDVVASKLVEGAADIAEAQQIIADSVAEIKEVIPDDAGVTNPLVTKDELDDFKEEVETDYVPFTLADDDIASDNKLTSVSTVETLAKAAADAVCPIGSIIDWPGSALPSDNFLWCDGSTFDSAEYPDLATLLNSNAVPYKVDTQGPLETFTPTQGVQTCTGYMLPCSATLGSNNNGYLYVNGVRMALLYNDAATSFPVPFKYGDNVTWSNLQGGINAVKYTKFKVIRAK